jgi:hypothetical protein
MTLSEAIAWLQARCDGSEVAEEALGVVVAATRAPDPKALILINQLRHACSCAFGDLIAHGMPQTVSTAKLLRDAIAAAVEQLEQGATN